MINFTADDYYMNHVYLGELWLWKYMEKNFSHTDNIRLQKQMYDEKKHSAMTRGALKKDLKKRDIKIFYTDTKFSIEHCIYQDLCGIDVDNLHPSYFPAFVYVVERRATFLFKNYVKYGKNEYYKKMTKRLIHDEIDHLDIHKQKNNADEIFLFFKKCDSTVWKKISEVYTNKNQAFFYNKQYWEDMFSGQLKEKCNVIHKIKEEKNVLS